MTTLAAAVKTSLVTNNGKIDDNRSPKWPSVRLKHLLAHHSCAACGSTTDLEVHHKKPYHLHPELELDPTNLLTLCESDKNGVNCHLLFGHLGDYHSYNPNVSEDAINWYIKMKARPKDEQ